MPHGKSKTSEIKLKASVNICERTGQGFLLFFCTYSLQELSVRVQKMSLCQYMSHLLHHLLAEV